MEPILQFIRTDTGATLEGYVVTEFPSWIDSGTPTTTGFIGPSDLDANDDFYNTCFCRFTTGALAGVRRELTDYTGASNTFVIDTLPQAPLVGDRYVIERAPVNLTSGSVSILYSIDEEAATTVSGSLDTTVIGKNRFTYTWLTGDFSGRGVLKVQISATLSDATVVTSLNPVVFHVGRVLP